LFHDSNGGPATPPPIGQNGGGGGGDTDPPPVVPAKTITRLNVDYGNYSSTVPWTTTRAWSKEGKKPDLTGITVQIWWSDGGIEIVSGDAVGSTFETVPAILGEAQLNNAGTITESAITPISIYHRASPGIMASVNLPGVRPLAYTSRKDDGVPSGTGFVSKNIYGANGGINFLGDFRGVQFFEDGDDSEIDLSRITVLVQYDLMQGGEFGTASPTTAPSATATGPQIRAVASDLVWERLTLTKDNLFLNYSVPTGAPTSDSTQAKFYAYGINPAGSVNIMISPAEKPTENLGVNNKSIYLAVPFNAGDYHYVRSVALAQPLNWRTGTYPFLIQTDLSGRSSDDWVTALITAGISPRVSYQGYDGTIDRTPEHFRRAWYLKKAGVTNDVILDPDNENFGIMMIGYYTSPLDGNGLRDPITKGDFTNAYVENVPIATYVEDSGRLAFQANAYPKDKDLEFISYWPAGTAGKTTFTTGKMEDAQLRALQNTYNFVMDFEYNGQTATGYTVIPGIDFRRAFFDNNPFYLRVGSEIEIGKEVTFRVPRTRALIDAAVTSPDNDALTGWYGPGGSNTNTTTYAQRAAKYAIVGGQEATFTVDLYPPEYDRN
jgi:hypothetical protein